MRFLSKMVAARRHEGLHRELLKVVGGIRTTSILANAKDFLGSSEDARHRAEALRNAGYSEQDLAGGGPGGRSTALTTATGLRTSSPNARTLLRTYSEILQWLPVRTRTANWIELWHDEHSAAVRLD